MLSRVLVSEPTATVLPMSSFVSSCPSCEIGKMSDTKNNEECSHHILETTYDKRTSGGGAQISSRENSRRAKASQGDEEHCLYLFFCYPCLVYHCLVTLWTSNARWGRDISSPTTKWISNERSLLLPYGLNYVQQRLALGLTRYRRP